MKKVLFLTTALLLIANLGWAAPFVLDNSPGDGSVTVGLDGFGAFGSSVGADSEDAIFDPVGIIGPAETTYESGIAIGFGAGRTFLTSGAIGGSGGLTNPAITGTATSGTSSFTFGDLLLFDAEYTLVPLFVGGSQTGSILTQTYEITNTGDTLIEFDLIRYLDGDLYFNGTLIDGGGRLFSGATEILFETDSATGSSDPTTFVGITGEGGEIPVTNRYEIDYYYDLRSAIISGSDLDDTVSNDGGDADQFIDAGSGYDVTLALRNVFSLAGQTSDVYTTQTIFGSGAPEEIPVSVPEPAGLLLLGSGLIGLAAFRRKFRK